eukprot:263193_1
MEKKLAHKPHVKLITCRSLVKGNTLPTTAANPTQNMAMIGVKESISILVTMGTMDSSLTILFSYFATVINLYTNNDTSAIIYTNAKKKTPPKVMVVTTLRWKGEERSAITNNSPTMNNKNRTRNNHFLRFPMANPVPSKT